MSDDNNPRIYGLSMHGVSRVELVSDPDHGSMEIVIHGKAPCDRPFTLTVYSDHGKGTVPTVEQKTTDEQFAELTR